MKYFLIILTCFISFSSHAGPCDCPWNVKKNGVRCGRGSAFCRAGGLEPQCGALSKAEINSLKDKYCKR